MRVAADRVRALVAANRLFTIALGAGAALRLVAMIGYPGALWFAGDSYVYLGAALRLRPDQSKTTGYSLLLRALEPLHSLTLVTGVQHLMGLGIAVMVYALARQAGVSQRWSVAAALPVLLDGFTIEDEHMVMAETLFTFLVVLALLLILRPAPSWRLTLLAGVLVGYAVTVRSEGIPVLALFPLAVGLRDRRRWRQWGAAGVMAVACAAPVLAYAAWFHSWTGSYALTRSDGFYLWGRVSSFADCAVIKPPAGEAKVCPSGTPSKRQPPGSYIWHAAMVHNLPGGPVSSANNALLRNFAIRAVERQPFGYMSSVFRGLLLSVEWPRKKYPSAGTVYDYYFQLKPQVVPGDRSWIPGGTAYADAAAYGHATPSRVFLPFATPIAFYERVVYTYGPLFGVILAVGAWGLWRRRGSAVPWVTAVVLLVSPVAVADFDYRYLLPVLPFAGLAAALTFAPAVTLDECPAKRPLEESSLSKG